MFLELPSATFNFLELLWLVAFRLLSEFKYKPIELVYLVWSFVIMLLCPKYSGKIVSIIVSFTMCSFNLQQIQKLVSVRRDLMLFLWISFISWGSMVDDDERF